MRSPQRLNPNRIQRYGGNKGTRVWKASLITPRGRRANLGPEQGAGMDQRPTHTPGTSGCLQPIHEIHIYIDLRLPPFLTELLNPLELPRWQEHLLFWQTLFLLLLLFWQTWWAPGWWLVTRKTKSWLEAWKFHYHPLSSGEGRRAVNRVNNPDSMSKNS